MIRIIIAVLGIFAILNVSAQTSLYGFVLNQQGDPVMFATIKFTLNESGPTKSFCVADTKGFYSLSTAKNLSKGYLEVSAVGYQTKIVPVLEISGEKQRIDVTLFTLEGNLPEVIIKGEPSIQISKDTISFRADAFKRGNEANIGRLLSNMPGFMVQENGKILFNGEPINRILIENDDLTGKNYEQLVNSMGTSGIDKIQVIKNFTNPEDITSSISNNSQQVLNIKFKKHFIGKILGTWEAQGGLPLPMHNIEGQTLSLIQKWKFISFQSLNTTGDLKISAEESASLKVQSPDDVSDIAFFEQPALASIADMKSGYAKNSPVYRNNSLLSTANFHFKPFKGLIIKGSIGYIKDDYRQSGAFTRTIFLYPSTERIVQEQEKAIRKKNKLLNHYVFINYLINKHNQVAFVLKGENKNLLHKAYGSIQSTSFDELIDGRNTKWSGKLVYNHHFRKTSALTWNLQYKKNKLPLAYELSPSVYDTLFGKSDSYQHLEQQEIQRVASTQTSIGYLKKYKRNLFDITFSGTSSSLKLLNRIDFYNVSLGERTVSGDSTNNINLLHQEISGKAKNVLTVSSALNLTLGFDLLWVHYQLKHKHGFYVPGVEKLKFLSSFSANYQLSPFDRLVVSYNSQNVLPPVRNTASGYFISGSAAVLKGNDTIQAGTAHTAQLIYSHINLADQRLLFFSGITFQRTPILHLSNQFPNRDFTFSAYETSHQQMDLFSFFIRMEKFLPGMRLKFTPMVNLSKGNTFTLIQSRKSPTHFTQIKVGTDFTANLGKFALGSGITYTLSSDLVSSKSALKNKAKRVEGYADLNWKFHPKMYLDMEVKKDIVYPPNQQSVHFLLANAQVARQSKNEKWKWGLKCNNLFNQQFYSYSVVSTNQATFASYQLLPRFLLATLQYKF